MQISELTAYQTLIFLALITGRGEGYDDQALALIEKHSAMIADHERRRYQPQAVALIIRAKEATDAVREAARVCPDCEHDDVCTAEANSNFIDNHTPHWVNRCGFQDGSGNWHCDCANAFHSARECSNCKGTLPLLNNLPTNYGHQCPETQPFTAADKADQPTDLTPTEAYTRQAILYVLDSGPWFFYEAGPDEPSVITEAEANEERLKFADAVIIRLREYERRLRGAIKATPELGYNDWIEARRDEEQPTLTSPTKLDAALASLKDKLAGAGSNVTIEANEPAK